MGFIFGNERSYSNLLELMENVGAEPMVTELSIAVWATWEFVVTVVAFWLLLISNVRVFVGGT